MLKDYWETMSNYSCICLRNNKNKRANKLLFVKITLSSTQTRKEYNLPLQQQTHSTITVLSNYLIVYLVVITLSTQRGIC